MYYPDSLFRSHDSLLSRCMCINTFVSGGAMGVALKLKSLWIHEYADIFEFNQVEHSKFRVIFICGINLFHSDNRKFRSISTRHDLK